MKSWKIDFFFSRGGNRLGRNVTAGLLWPLMQAPTSGSLFWSSGQILLASVLPSLPDLMITGETWGGCSVLGADASPRQGVRAGDLAASAGLWVLLDRTWGRLARSQLASSRPSHKWLCVAFVPSVVAVGMRALDLSSGKSLHSWVSSVPWRRRSPALIYSQLSSGQKGVCPHLGVPSASPPLWVPQVGELGRDSAHRLWTQHRTVAQRALWGWLWE